MSRILPGRFAGLALAIAALVLLIFATYGWLRPSLPDPKAATASYLVGADYLTTFPEDFQSGSLRSKLQPPQKPQLGLYDAADLKVVETHIDWAAQHGIDFFVLRYSPHRAPRDLRPQLFSQASNIDDIHFCLSYPLADLGLDKQPSPAKVTAELIKGMEEIAESYLGHPQYLKVGARPVIVLRDSGQLRGDYEGALASIREALGRKSFDVFLVGDEVAWPGQSHRPEARRLQLFDAVTTHNLLPNTSPEQSGYGASSSLLADLGKVHKQYADATQGLVPVLPVVQPGFNDRGDPNVNLPEARVDPSSSHGIIPRSWEAGQASGSFMSEMLDEYTLPTLDPKVPIIFIDSWNDWRKDTAIEPLQFAPPTSEDVSGRQLYTGGYLYSGYGNLFLELVRDKLIAISGSLTHDQEGYPLPGVPVAAWRDGEILAVDITDSQGRFQLSRFTLKPGDYRVGATYAESSEVTVEARVSALVKIEGHVKPPAQPGKVENLDPLFPSLRVGLSEFLARPASQETYLAGGQRIYAGPQAGTLRDILQADGEWEPEIARLLEETLSPGQTVVEIGSGVGIHALLAARLVGEQGRVFAFEADRRNLRELVLNANLNGVENIKALWYAISDRAGTVPGPDGAVVEKRTLDSFHIPQVALVRVDEQGIAEQDILSGARALLLESQPKVLLKVEQRSQLPYLMGNFASLGYMCTPVPGTDYLLGLPFGGGEEVVLLDLGSKKARKFMEEGFSIDERDRSGNDYVWSDDIESLLYLPLARVLPRKYALGVRAKAFEPLAPVKVQLLLNGALAGEIDVTDQWTGAELTIPDGLLVEGVNTVLFRYGKIGRPWGLLPGNLDGRALSVAIDRVWLYPRDLEAGKP